LTGELAKPEARGGADLLLMSPSGCDLDWYCLHTRTRREKRVARACQEQGVEYYLPLRRSVKHYGNRRREHTAPYFPGYLFCAATPGQRYDLICTGHLVRAIPVLDKESLLRDLQEIEKALRVSAELGTFPYLKRGQRVRITTGPFRGIEGVVSERRGQFRVVLNIDFIQRALAIEIDADGVEPA